MTTDCDIILQWGATPEQLAALGSALWRWRGRRAKDTAIYQYLDNQALSDLIAGKLPMSRQTPPQSDQVRAHFRFRDESSHDREETIRSLRLEIPAEGVEDIVVDGVSWNPKQSKTTTRVLC
jgi:hypothetical protein